MRRLFISAIAIVPLLIAGSKCYGQTSNFEPYFGASVNVDTSVAFGLGIEVGLHYLHLYAGLEYGAYSLHVPIAETEDIPPGAILPPQPLSSEKFWGGHVGYVFNNRYYIGIVILRSNQLWGRGDSVLGYITYKNYYLNLGPDFRYSGLDEGHMYLAFALTIRRGLKAGLGYMF